MSSPVSVVDYAPKQLLGRTDEPTIPIEDLINPVQEIRRLLRTLTYGETMDLSKQLWMVSKDGITETSLPQNLWDWAVGT